MEPSRPSPHAAPLQLLSVVIPARDEANCIASTVEHLDLELRLHEIPHEIVVVDDGSTGSTWAILTDLKRRLPALNLNRNHGPHGFGRAVIHGLDHSRGDAVVIMMADESDDSRDVVKYWNLLNEGYDCVFGSRFMSGGGVIDYPRAKLIINRLANLFISLLFRIKFNDTTNAFKAYRRVVIDGCRPLISPHFNLTVELPLKAIVRGFSWTTMPITWRNRRIGVSKLKLKEMGGRYLFICLYAWLEKYFSRGDYHRNSCPNATAGQRSLKGEHSQTVATTNGWMRGHVERGTAADPRVAGRTLLNSFPFTPTKSCKAKNVANDKSDLATIYSERFKGKQAYRSRVWRVLIQRFFQPYIPAHAVVLDLGCGYGEFINNVSCSTRFGMDLNPNTAKLLAPEVHFLHQDCSATWNLPDASLDIIFTSNFFEHLPDKSALASTLGQARRCLRPGGKLIAIGPNIKYLSGAYWDFWDHFVPLTDKSLAEGLTAHGLEVVLRIDRFLPYTMSRRIQYPLLFLQFYLNVPLIWRLFGKQFLVIAQTKYKARSDESCAPCRHSSALPTP